MKLDAYLVKNRITIKEFAASIGLTYEGLRLILRGERDPLPKTMRAILRVTNRQVTPNDLLME